jgi:hypothetical protein
VKEAVVAVPSKKVTAQIEMFDYVLQKPPARLRALAGGFSFDVSSVCKYSIL